MLKKFAKLTVLVLLTTSIFVGRSSASPASNTAEDGVIELDLMIMETGYVPEGLLCQKLHNKIMQSCSVIIESTGCICWTEKWDGGIYEYCSITVTCE